jgi:urocanate hydratase
MDISICKKIYIFVFLSYILLNLSMIGDIPTHQPLKQCRYRFRPTEYEMRAYPIQDYPAKNIHAAAMQLQIMNNLDKRVAQFPHELITYGGNGSVFSNWAQYHIVMMYLSHMTDEQTLVMYSGHPMGLFPSSPAAPR